MSAARRSFARPIGGRMPCRTDVDPALAERLQPARRLAQTRCRVRGRRRVRAGDGAVLRLAGAVDHAAGAGVADRRSNRARPRHRATALVSAARDRWRPRSAGGSASAISWPACSGSARRFSSRPRSSPSSAVRRDADAGRSGAVLRGGRRARGAASGARVPGACWRWPWRCRRRSGCAAMC